MGKKIVDKIKSKMEEFPPEVLINEDQACNEFQLTGTTRTHVLKKFKGMIHSTNEWTQIFKDQRII